MRVRSERGTATASILALRPGLRRRRKVGSGGVSLLLRGGALVLALLGGAHLVPTWADVPALELVASSTTVVVTSTLTSFASESLVGGGFGSVWNRRLAAIAIIFAGALAGALLLRLGIAVPLMLAAVLTVSVVAVGHRTLHVPAGS